MAQLVQEGASFSDGHPVDVCITLLNTPLRSLHTSTHKIWCVLMTLTCMSEDD